MATIPVPEYLRQHAAQTAAKLQKLDTKRARQLAKLESVNALQRKYDEFQADLRAFKEARGEPRPRRTACADRARQTVLITSFCLLPAQSPASESSDDSQLRSRSRSRSPVRRNQLRRSRSRSRSRSPVRGPVLEERLPPHLRPGAPPGLQSGPAPRAAPGSPSARPEHSEASSLQTSRGRAAGARREAGAGEGRPPVPSTEVTDLHGLAVNSLTRFMRSYSQSMNRSDRGKQDLTAKYKVDGKAGKFVDAMTSGQLFTEMMNDLELTGTATRSEYNQTDYKRVADLYELFVFLEWQWRAGGPLEDPSHPVLRLLPKVQIVNFMCACESKAYFSKLPVRVNRRTSFRS